MKVVLVCAGNICRSPMAEALFRRDASFHAALRDLDLSSAGVLGLQGSEASELAVRVMRDDYGLDISRHRARGLEATAGADLVLTLDRRVHARAVASLPHQRVELLGTYAGAEGEEVLDPYEGPIEGYRVAARHIAQLVGAAVARLARELSGFDLPAYLRKIGVNASCGPDLDTLRTLHRRHQAAIPFENLDIQMGLPISLDLVHLQDKLVRRRRGGYCFEQNTVFLHALRAIGFDVIACEARVQVESRHVLPRTHMTLVVRLDEQRHLCDVGFGGDGPLEPVSFDGDGQRQSHWTYRLAPHGPGLVLQSLRAGAWSDLYAFLPEPRYPVDFEMANWFTSTLPTSRFVVSLTAQRSTSDARHVLRNLTLTTWDGRGIATREITRADLVPLLQDTMGLDVPLDARFRALDGD